MGTWAASPTGVPTREMAHHRDRTVRQVVHTSVGGSAVRVRLTNEFGDRPLVVGAAHVAVAGDPSGRSVRPDSDRVLTFGGSPEVTVPAGAPAVSDPVELSVPGGAELVVSVYLPERTAVSTVHGSAYQRNFLADGNVVGRTDVVPVATFEQWQFLSGVSVLAPARASAVVALGDSITDGADSTVGANRRWPDVLAARFRATPGLDHLGVLNQGISGNRLLHDPNPPAGSLAEGFAGYFGEGVLRRFDRDVLAHPGVSHLVVLIGVNDLGHPGPDGAAPESERVTAAELVDGHRQLVARARQHGLRVFGGTVLPFAGREGFSSPRNERARQELNEWIRSGGEYDGVVDFDAALRDPDRPEAMAERFDSGDHLHPGDAGLAAMAHAVPLEWF